MVVAVLAADTEIAFPHRIAEYELRGPEIVAALGAVFNVVAGTDVVGINGRLLRAVVLYSLVEKAVHVPVDAKIAHLAVVIGIEDVFAEVVVAADVALRTLSVNAVDVVVGIEVSI